MKKNMSLIFFNALQKLLKIDKEQFASLIKC